MRFPLIARLAALLALATSPALGAVLLHAPPGIAIVYTGDEVGGRP